MEVVLLGRPNVGKTLLLLNFAAYLGANEIIRHEMDHRSTKVPMERARRELVSFVGHKVVDPITVTIERKSNSGREPLVFFDGAGVAEGIHPDYRVRRAIAETLDRLGSAEVVLHVVDSGQYPVASLDDALCGLIGRIAPSLILANKIDLHHETALKALRLHFAGHTVLPLSGLTRRGFRELKQDLYQRMDQRG